MFKNVSSQKLIVYVFDSTTNLPKTGDAANLTAYVSKDWGAATVLGDTSATELDATNAKGYYLFDVTQAETNADTLHFTCKSSTANMVALAMPAVQYTTPPNFSTLSVDGSGNAKVADTQKVDVNTIKTQAVTAAAGVTVLASVGTAATSTAQTGDNFARIGTAGAGLTALGDGRIANLDAAVSTRMAAYTQPAGFLAAIFSATVGDATAANQITINNNVLTRSSHSAADVWTVATRVLTAGTNIQLPANGLANVTAWTVAITGNITGTVATVTNLTNAPTAGDFTAAMKTSLNAATPAVTVSDKTGFRLASNGLDAVIVEAGLNARQALAILASAEGGVLAGAATTTITIAAAGVPATNRITATVDADGNRTAVTLTPPA